MILKLFLMPFRNLLMRRVLYPGSSDLTCGGGVELSYQEANFANFRCWEGTWPAGNGWWVRPSRAEMVRQSQCRFVPNRSFKDAGTVHWDFVSNFPFEKNLSLYCFLLCPLGKGSPSHPWGRGSAPPFSQWPQRETQRGQGWLSQKSSGFSEWERGFPLVMGGLTSGSAAADLPTPFPT